MKTKNDCRKTAKAKTSGDFYVPRAVALHAKAGEECEGRYEFFCSTDITVLASRLLTMRHLFPDGCRFVFEPYPADKVDLLAYEILPPRNKKRRVAKLNRPVSGSLLRRSTKALAKRSRRKPSKQRS